MKDQFRDMLNIMLTLFGSLIMLIIALFGYIFWDRRTALRPLEEKVERIEQELVRDFDIRNQNGSLMTRVVVALREVGQNDANVKNALGKTQLL